MLVFQYTQSVKKNNHSDIPGLFLNLPYFTQINILAGVYLSRPIYIGPKLWFRRAVRGHSFAKEKLYLVTKNLLFYLE